MFDLEKFASGEYYVHLPTLEVYHEAMKYLNDNGFIWLYSNPAINNATARWSIHKQHTCINYEINRTRDGLLCGNLDFYKEAGYTQLELLEKGELT